MERTMQEKEELEMDHCEETEVHEELLRIVQEKLPKEEELYDLAELYKVFGDSTRIRILFVLFEAEVCVCDLAAALQMTQSAISHQLRILKQNKLVKSRREGKSIFLFPGGRTCPHDHQSGTGAYRGGLNRSCCQKESTSTDLRKVEVLFAFSGGGSPLSSKIIFL